MARLQTLLSRVLQEGEDSSRVDVVFDVYREISIKSAERKLRGESDAVTFKNLAVPKKINNSRIFYEMATTKQVLSDLLWSSGKKHRVERD